MAYRDWSVVVLDVVAHPTVDTDASGLLLSLVTMTLTHTASGKVLQRSDVMAAVSAASLAHLARGLIDVAEQNMAVQTSGQTPSPLQGLLSLAMADPRTQAQKDRDAFDATEADLNRTADLIKRLKDADPASVRVLDSLIEPKRAARTVAAGPVITTLVAG